MLLFMHHFESGPFIYARRDVQYGVHSAPSLWMLRAPWLGQADGDVSPLNINKNPTRCNSMQ